MSEKKIKEKMCSVNVKPCCTGFSWSFRDMLGVGVKHVVG